MRLERGVAVVVVYSLVPLVRAGNNDVDEQGRQSGKGGDCGVK
jgi:hypothetical protein